jgi:hypothetical protein
MEAHRSERRGRGDKQDATTEQPATNEGLGDGPPSADYPSVLPAGPGREATDEEFRELFGNLDPDEEP